MGRTTVNTAFGAVLREQRNQQKLTQERLAETAGVSAYYVILLEGGKRQPSLSVLFRLADALGTTPDELVRRVRLRLSA